MLQIIIQGRGGQGAQLAGTLLAAAFFAEGREVQSFATYGGARRGTPVSSFIRVDDRPIRLRCDIERADALLCFDASLLEGRLLAAAGPRTLIVVNSRRPPEHYASALPGYRILPVSPKLSSVLGEAAVASLGELRERVDLVNLFRASAHVPAHAEEILALAPRPRAVWMQLGISHPEAARRLEAAGIRVVEDRCLMVEHARLLG